jgi:Zn-dependent protease
MKLSLYLGSYRNIKVFIHWTFSLLLLWIIVSNVLAGAPIPDILWTVTFVLGLFLCVLLHEFGHALAAQNTGFPPKTLPYCLSEGWLDWRKSLKNPSRNFGWR